MSPRPSLSGIFVFLCAVVASAQPEKTEPPAPVPDGSSIEKAEKLVKEVYKADYAKKKSAEQLEFARKLLKAAEETKDGAAKFVLLREAREMAARYGDVYLAFDVVAATTQSFAIKSTELKFATLEAAEKAKIAPSRSVAEAALDAVDEAILSDDYVTAERLVKLAGTVSSRANLTSLTASVGARGKDLEAIRKAYEALEPDRKALAANAGDPAANEKIGRFSCLMKGDWETGLPLLAKGANEQLKAVAALDQAKSMGAERAAVGDRWLEQVDKLEPTERSEAKMRAYGAYLQASFEAAGLEKTRIEKRILDLEKSEPKIIRMKGNWTVIFRSADPSIWNANVNRGRDLFAIALSKVNADIRYLKLTDASKNNSVIIEMSKLRLGDRTEQDGYGWNGKNTLDSKGYHLGVYDPMWKDWVKGTVCIYAPAVFNTFRGWGFGHRAAQDDEQGFSWNGEPVAKTVFEIAVKSNALTADESKRLLKKKK